MRKTSDYRSVIVDGHKSLISKEIVDVLITDSISN